MSEKTPVERFAWTMSGMRPNDIANGPMRYIREVDYDKLERELTQAQARCAEVLGECEECGHTIVTPLKHLSSTQNDAERYRWMKANKHSDLALDLCLKIPDGDWDTAIDEALKAQDLSAKRR